MSNKNQKVVDSPKVSFFSMGVMKGIEFIGVLYTPFSYLCSANDDGVNYLTLLRFFL